MYHYLLFEIRKYYNTLHYNADYTTVRPVNVKQRYSHVPDQLLNAVNHAVLALSRLQTTLVSYLIGISRHFYVPYPSASAVVFHYKEALYQVRAPLPYLYF